MEMQLPKKKLEYMNRLVHEVKSQELTQELRMPDEMPDTGKILNTWGQILIRGKQWQADSVTVSGGVMAWVLYVPEKGDQQPQIVETWIPFQMKLDLPQTPYDGNITVVPYLCSTDARSTSARKMMLRVTVALYTDCWVADQAEVFQPQQTEGVYTLTKRYPLTLAREAGEKEFTIEEELTLPPSCPPIEKIVRFSIQPELIDCKVLSGKVAFRGVALLHILYMDAQDVLHCWDFEIPFSQYDELGTQYEQQATANIYPVVTSLELDTDTSGKLLLKAGIIGQYVIYDTTVIEVTEDAYSPNHIIELKTEQLRVPAVLDETQKTVTMTGILSEPDADIADIGVCMRPPKFERYAENGKIQLSGAFHVLQYEEGQLCGITIPWENSQEFTLGDKTQLQQTGVISGIPKAERSGNGLQLSVDVLLRSVITGKEGITVIRDMTIAQKQTRDSNRPSLILMKGNGSSLWELAKTCGSTVETIRQANGLQQEPGPDQILLIPVVS